MANQATLQLVLEMREKVSAEIAKVSGKLGDLSRRATETQAALAKAMSGGDSSQIKAAAAAAKQAEGDYSRFRRETEQLANSQIRLAVASKDYTSALKIIDTQLSVTQKGTVRYNNLLAQQATLQERASKAPPPIAGGGQGLGSLVAGFGAATVAAGLFQQSLQGVANGYKLVAEIDQAQRALSTLVGSVNDGNAIMQEAIAFGQKYGFTQKEMADAAARTAIIFENTTESTGKTLEVLGRLAALNPAEGLEGATVAFRELASGDIVSIAERFNIARGAANKMKDEILAGADPVRILDAELARMGVTTDVLSNRMEGPNAGLVKMQLAVEKAQLAAGKFLVTIGAPDALAAFANGIARIAEAASLLLTPLDEARAALAATAIQGKQSYAEYAAEADKAKESNIGFANTLTRIGMSGGPALAPLAALGIAFEDNAEKSDKLTEAQYRLAQTFIKQGIDATRATEGVQTASGRVMLMAEAFIKANNPAAEFAKQLTRLNTTGVTKATADLKKMSDTMAKLGEDGPAALRKIADLQADFGRDMERLSTDHGKTLQRLQDATGKDLQKLAETTGKAITKIQQQEHKDREKLAADHAERLTEINDTAYQRAQDLVRDHNAKVRDLERDGLIDLQRMHTDHQDKLAELETTGGERRLQLAQDNQRSIDDILANAAEQQASLLESHQEKITDLQEQAAEQRERLDRDHGRALVKLQEQLAAETDEEQRAAIQARIDQEQEGYQQEIGDLEAQTAKRLAKEQADYEKREAKRKAEVEKRLAAQRADFEREQAEQEKALQKQIDAEQKAWTKREEQHKTGLQARLAAEVVSLEQELAETEAARQKQTATEQESHTERLEENRARAAEAIEQARASYAEQYQARVDALNEQRTAEIESYNERRADRQEQYAIAYAEEQQHLGKLLQLQATAMAEAGTLDKEHLDGVLASLAERYGIIEDESLKHWQRLSGHVGVNTDAIIRHILSIPSLVNIDLRMRAEQVAASAAGSVAAGIPIGPARAAGGNVWPGTAFRVGEHGSELFIPQVSGQIIPHNQMNSYSSSSAETYEIHVDARGSTLSAAEIEAAVERAMNKAAQKGMTRKKEKGGY